MSFRFRGALWSGMPVIGNWKCNRSCTGGGSLAALLLFAIPVAAQQNGEVAQVAATPEADLRSDLGSLEITDRSTLKKHFDTLRALALIEGDYASAIVYAERVRSIEDDPALRFLAGTLERALAEAAAAPMSYREQAFEDAYRKVISGLPYEQVQAELKSLKGTIEMSPGPSMGTIEPQGRLMIEVLEPFREEMVAVLEETIVAHTNKKP